MFDSGLLLASRPSRSVVLSAGSTTGVDVFALAGSPSIAVDLVLTIGTDIEITGLSLAGFTSDSYIYLVCAGYLMGPGGIGGNGYTTATPDILGEPGDPAIPSTPGGPGGTGLILPCPLTLDLSAGYIYGGGGGGGGGGELDYGGGGGGVFGGLGGDGGGGVSPATDGGDATFGPTATPGLGGDNGGDGGDKGEVGGPGLGPFSSVGGAAGLAINTSGYALQFVGKDQATLVTESRLIGAVT